MIIALGFLALTALVERYAGDAYAADIQSVVAQDTDTLARHLSELIARESAAVDALVAFVENHAMEESHLSEEFPGFAAAFMELGETIRSVQIAPGGILEYVYPVEGNEAAVGLDLMADERRRILLEPAIESGSTVIQGPVELVQGGTGLIVRRPIYVDDAYWGLSAVVLDWPAVSEMSGLESTGRFDLAGIKLAESAEVIAGSPEAFEGDPVIRELEVGGTDTAWLLAQRPVDGWPTVSPESAFIWAAGVFAALLTGFFSFSLIRRPELLRRERQKALDELHALEARYLAIFENAGVGIVLADTEGSPISANPKFREIVGIGRGDPVSDVDMLNMLGERDRQAFLTGMKRLLNGAPVFEVEARIMGAEVDRWCRMRTSLITGDSQEEKYAIAVVEDATERHQAEEALAASEVRYRQLFELAPIAIQREDHTAVAEEVRRLRRAGVTNIRAHAESNPAWLKDLLGRVPIVDENPAAAELQETMAQGKRVTLLDRYTKEAESTFIESIVAVDEGRSRISQSVETRRSDGSPLVLDLRWQAPVVDGVPDYANVMVTLSDITELRETERQLRELMESKDRFLASVAHELRTPLTAVVGFAQELQDPGGIYSVREKSEFQDLIAFHGAEMADIIEDLLVWARGDIGEVQVMPESIDLTQCLKGSLRLMPQVEIPLTGDSKPVHAVADPSRVRQIARNLATNAIRHGGDRIEASVRREGGVALVEMRDDGPEIPQSVTRRMFEPYQRGELDASKPGSIGLGLTVARTLARLQEGDLTYVREGTCNVFRLTLPLAAHDDQSETASPLVSVSD